MITKNEKRRITENACSLLKGQINLLANVNDSKSLDSWFRITKNFIESIYTNKSGQYSSFIRYVDKNNATIYLEGLIREIKALGLPQNSNFASSKGDIIFNNNNNLSQTQNIEINIMLDTIQDELPPAKMREIQEIAESEEPKESKLKKVVEILKNTGTEVVSSTLARVIGQAMGIY